MLAGGDYGLAVCPRTRQVYPRVSWGFGQQLVRREDGAGAGWQLPAGSIAFTEAAPESDYGSLMLVALP